MTKPTQLILRDLPSEHTVKPGFDIEPVDLTHAPTSRAAIDKERIEELEAEVERLKSERGGLAVGMVNASETIGTLRARITELEWSAEEE